MAGKKISELGEASSVQDGNDFVIAQSGASKKLDRDNLTLPESQVVGVSTFGCEVGGLINSAAPVVGLQKCWMSPRAGSITRVTVLGDVSGNIVWDIWAQDDGSIPVIGGTITAAAKPTLSGAFRSVDSTLTGWTKIFAADTIFAFYVDSVSTLAWSGLYIEYEVT